MVSHTQSVELYNSDEFLNQMSLPIVGTIDLYLEARLAGKSFQ